ncbi:MAG: hypothetical protein WAP52_01765 [Candidatus Sungiibacteriota bacterium]
MDLLEQYKQQNPEVFREQKPVPMTDEYGREYSGMTALMIRLSGGRIQNAKQANWALLVLAGLAALSAFFLFVRDFNLLPPPRFSEEEARKQMEEYKKIQPF